MTGLTLTKQHYVTVITDGSNGDTVEYIKLVFDLLGRQEMGATKCKPLSISHPTMLVVESEIKEPYYEEIKETIEKLYPGLCIFNAIIS